MVVPVVQSVMSQRPPIWRNYLGYIYRGRMGGALEHADSMTHSKIGVFFLSKIDDERMNLESVPFKKDLSAHH